MAKDYNIDDIEITFQGRKLEPVLEDDLKPVFFGIPPAPKWVSFQLALDSPLISRLMQLVTSQEIVPTKSVPVPVEGFPGFDFSARLERLPDKNGNAVFKAVAVATTPEPE